MHLGLGRQRRQRAPRRLLQPRTLEGSQGLLLAGLGVPVGADVLFEALHALNQLGFALGLLREAVVVEALAGWEERQTWGTKNTKILLV